MTEVSYARDAQEGSLHPSSRARQLCLQQGRMRVLPLPGEVLGSQPFASLPGNSSLRFFCFSTLPRETVTDRGGEFRVTSITQG